MNSGECRVSPVNNLSQIGLNANTQKFMLPSLLALPLVAPETTHMLWPFMRMFPPFNSNEGSQVMFLWRSKRNYLRIILKTPPYLRLRVFMHTILLWQPSILPCFNLKHLPFAYNYCIYLKKGWILSYCVNNPLYTFFY